MAVVCFLFTFLRFSLIIYINIVTFLTLISDLFEDKQHHVKTGETTYSQTENKYFFTEKKRQEKFHLHSVWTEFHIQT